MSKEVTAENLTQRCVVEDLVGLQLAGFNAIRYSEKRPGFFDVHLDDYVVSCSKVFYAIS